MNNTAYLVDKNKSIAFVVRCNGSNPDWYHDVLDPGKYQLFELPVKEEKYKVNLISGSGSMDIKEGWIFSRIAREIEENINNNSVAFEVTVTAEPDTSKEYDIYHYLHSTLAAKYNYKLFKSLVTVIALDDIAEHRTFFNKRMSLLQARCISTICRYNINELIRNGIQREKIYYTPLGTELDRYIPIFDNVIEKLIENKVINEDSLLNSSYIKFGLFGRYYDDDRKGTRFLLDAIKLFKYRNSEARIMLVCVGTNWENSPYIKEIERIIPVEYIQTDIENYHLLYNCMDCVVVPSKIEAGPMCILESLACGVPVISTPGGHSNDFVSRIDDCNNRPGYIVGYDDVVGLTLAMEDFISNIEKFRSKEYRKRISSILRESYSSFSNPEWIKDNFVPYSWENMAKRFEAIYAQMVMDIIPVSVFECDRKTLSEIYNKESHNWLSSQYLENFIFLHHIAQKGIGIYNFAGVLRDLPIVLLGIGPSLDKHVELLQEHRDNIVLMACDAALPKLNSLDIKPDIVVVADPSDRQWKNFQNIDCSEFITVMPTIAHYLTYEEAKRSKAKIVWYNVNDGNVELCKYIPRVVGQKGAMLAGVLTSGSMIQAAVHMAARPIAFLGHDLCWYDLDIGYAKGISKEKEQFQKMSKMNNILYYEDIFGNKVATEMCFVTFVMWLQEYLATNNIIVYNASECGILQGDNIIQIKFSEWIQQFEKDSIAKEAKTKLIDVYNFYTTTICDFILSPQYK